MRKGFSSGDPRAITAGQRGGAKSAALRKKARRIYWSGLGIDPELGEWIRRQGYAAGWKARGKSFARHDQPQLRTSTADLRVGNRGEV